MASWTRVVNNPEVQDSGTLMVDPSAAHNQRRGSLEITPNNTDNEINYQVMISLPPTPQRRRIAIARFEYLKRLNQRVRDA